MWSKFKRWIINEVFKREYRLFHYPFETVDSLLNQLSPEERYDYLYEGKRFFISKCFKSEYTELKKLYYKELALMSKSDIERAGYRLSLMFIRKLERRLKYLTDKFHLEQRMENVQKKIK